MLGRRLLAAALALLAAVGRAGRGRAAARPPDHRRARRRLLRQRPALDLRHHPADLPRRLPRRRRLHRLHLQHRRQRLLPEVRRRRPHRPSPPRSRRRSRRSPTGARRRAPPRAPPTLAFLAAGAPRRRPRGGALGRLPAGDPDRRGRRSPPSSPRCRPRSTAPTPPPPGRRSRAYAAGGRASRTGASAPPLRDLAVAAGINAFLRAGTDAEAGEARPPHRRRARGGRRGPRLARRPPPRRGPRPRPGDRRRRRARRGALRLPRHRPAGRLRGGEPARLLHLLRAPRRRRRRLRRLRPRRRRHLPGRGPRPPALHRRPRPRQPLPGDPARRPALRRRRAAARLGRRRRSTSATARRPCASPAAPTCCRRAPRPRSRSSRSTPPRPTLQLYRVGTRNVATVLGNGDFGSPLTGAEETRLRDTLGEPVWKGTGELAPGAQPRRHDDAADGRRRRRPRARPLRADRPRRRRPRARGLGGDSATQWFVVTDLGLATLTGADGLHVFLRGLSDAAARDGVDGQAPRAQQRRPRHGRRPTPRATPASTPACCAAAAAPRPALVTAEAGQDYAFLSLAEPGFDLSDRGVAGRPAPPPVDVFVYDRARRLPPGRDGLRHRPRPRRPRPRRRGPDADRHRHPRRRRRVRPLSRSPTRAPAAARSPSRSAPAPRPAAGASRSTPTREAPPLATATFLVEDFTPERVDLALTLPDGPIDPAAPPDARRPRRLPLGRPRRRPRARGRDPRRHGPRRPRPARLPLRPRGRALRLRLRRPRPRHHRRRRRCRDSRSSCRRPARSAAR